MQRLAVHGTDEQDDQNGLHLRDYTLNMSKAMKKKVTACNVEYKVRASNRGGNQIFEFSAAMYELYRNSLTQHFETLQSHESTNMKIEYRDIIDKSNSCVESVVKVYNKDNSSLKYTINLYHTKSKVMVNGRKAGLFNVEHIQISCYY